MRASSVQPSVPGVGCQRGLLKPPEPSNAETTTFGPKRLTEFQKNFMEIMPTAAKQGLVMMNVQDSDSLPTDLQKKPAREKLLILVEVHGNSFYVQVDLLVEGREKDELIVSLHSKGGGDVELWRLLTSTGWIPDGF